VSPTDTTVEPRIEELIEDIKAKRRDRLESKINRWKRNNPILSDISDCDRQMVYGVLNWEDKPLHDAELQARFDEGNEQERKVIRELQELGYDVILSQQPVIVKGKDGITLATGKIDGFIKFRGRRFPMEVKSMNPHVYDGVDSIEDFDKKPWLRKYIRQLMMYMFGNNEEQGFFICTNCLGGWKLLPMFLDYGVCEQILQRLERDYVHVQAKTYPDRIPYSRELCGKCAFAHICLPDIINSGIEMVDMPDLESKLRRMEELEPNADEFLTLDKETKDVARGVGHDFIIGSSYKAEIKTITSKRLDTKAIPIDVRSKYEIETVQQRISFVPLGK
jgi:hypothetical protein